MYSAILLPVDGSVGMAGAIRHALHQAQLHDAPVHVLYVVDLRAYVMLPDETKGDVRDLLRAEGEEAVAAVEDRAAAADVEAVPAIVEGVPHEVILSYADDHDLDLIVMGTHGRTGDQHRLLGSVAEEVVRNADVPVMTVRMGEEALEALEADVPEEQRRYIA